MSDTTVAPKKSSLKKILAIISAVLVILLGTNHVSLQLGYVEISAIFSDSTAVITVAPVDSLPVTDTIKLDTIK